VIYKIVTV